MLMYSDAQLETDQKRKDCMVYPKKNFMIDQRKTAWLIQKKIHRWSMQIQLGSICIAIHDSAIPSTFPLTLPGQAKWSQAVAYLGGYWAMAPFCPRTFFWHWKKIGKLGLAPFVWALVASKTLASFWNPEHATVARVLSIDGSTVMLSWNRDTLRTTCKQ